MSLRSLRNAAKLYVIDASRFFKLRKTRNNSLIEFNGDDTFVFACHDRITHRLARKDQRYSLLTKKMTFQRNSFGSGEKSAIQFLSLLSSSSSSSLVDQVRQHYSSVGRSH